MAQNYTRQSTFADGDTITAALFNNEYNQLVNAFAYSSSSAGSTGHRHDGTAGHGGNIHTIGDLDFLNKVVVDGTNNRVGFFVEVSSSAVEQVRVQDGAIVPVTDNDIDLGTSSLEFKDAFFDGTVKTDTLTVDENAAIAGNLSVAGNLTGSGVTSGARASVSAGTGISYNSGTGVITCTIDTPAEVGLGNLSNNGNNLSGNFVATGNVTAFSDERLKENVETIEGALDKVSQMRGVTYNYKSELNDGQRGTGVIAQEMQQVMPEVVEEGEYLSVAYGNIVGVLIEAVKELKEELNKCKCKKCECE